MNEEQILKVQALLVTDGPFAGRICENDDDEFLSKSELADWEIEWFDAAGLRWRQLTEGDEIGDEPLGKEFYSGADCEIVTFGFYLACRGHYRIPRQFLRPATTRDLVQRLQKIGEHVSQDVWLPETSTEPSEIVDPLKEENYILNELWRREKMATDVVEPRDVFLCHSSEDKWFVRQVWSDLLNVGHKPWLDEYEIKVGDSIVEKIDQGTGEASALVLFLSKTSVESSWVKREWSSALARQLSRRNIRVFPVIVEECAIPNILSDIKYADFRESYNAGLEDLLNGLK